MSRVAFITGAASGIGAGLTQLLLSRNWSVFAADIAVDPSRLSDQGVPVEVGKGTLVWHRLDVRKADEWVSSLEAATVQVGFPDVLVNNAGIISPGWVAENTPEQIDRHIDVNLKGVMFGTSLYAAACRRQQKPGHIINLASMAALAPVPGLAAYSASKFGVRSYSLSAAQELRPYGIAVTTVCPDLVDTPMLDQQLHRKEALLTFSGPRPLEVEQVAEAIWEAIQKQPLECIIPAYRGWLAKLASTFPGLMPPLQKMLERQGRKGADKLRRNRNQPE